MHSPGGASYFLSRHCDVIASFSFGACIVYTEYFVRFKIWKYTISDFSFAFKVLSTLLWEYIERFDLSRIHCYQIIMSSPGQKHGSCGHIMASFNSQGMVQSPGSSSGTKKKKFNPSDKSKVPSTKHSKEKPIKSPTSNPHRSSADARIEELDQKWIGSTDWRLSCLQRH